MALRRHLRILAGGIEEPRMTPTIKAAFATSDRHKIDQHFGAASAILIHAVTPEQATELLANRDVQRAYLGREQDA